MFTCDDLLDKVAKLLPEVLETLESYARFHPWAEGFVRGVLELPVEDLLITCHEETIALGSRSRVEAEVVSNLLRFCGIYAEATSKA